MYGQFGPFGKYTIYAYIGIGIGSLFILFIISTVIKNSIYNKIFRQKKKIINHASYIIALQIFIKDKFEYHKKLRKIKIISIIQHYFFSAFFVSIIGGLIYLLATISKFVYVGSSLEITYYVISGLEIIFLIISVLQTDRSIHRIVTESIQTTNSKKITLLVAFGGSDLMGKMGRLNVLIQNGLKVFEPSNIIICYNYRENPDEIVLNALNDLIEHTHVKYVAIPVPNKSYAITWASKNWVETEYIMTIDDDVFIPPDINLPIDIKIDVWAYMLCAEKPTNDMTVFQKYLTYCQDLEYRFSGLIKQLQSSFQNSTTLTHHGAISLYNKKKFDSVMMEHDGVFDGEDYEMGIISYSQGNLMKVVPEQYVPTVVPSSFWVLAKQRIISWDYVILKFIIDNFYVVFKPECKNFITKIVALLNLWTIYQDFIRIPNIIFLALYSKNYYWLILYVTVSIIAKSLCMLLILYVRNSFNATTIPLKYGLFMLIGFPIYTVITMIFRLLGQLRYLIWYDSRIRDNVKLRDRPDVPNILSYSNHNNNFNQKINWATIFTRDGALSNISQSTAVERIIRNRKNSSLSSRSGSVSSNNHTRDVIININHSQKAF